MAEGGKDRTIIYVVLALVVLWFISQEVNKATTAAKSLSGAAGKSVGYGIGQGVVDSGASAIGKFVGGFFSTPSSSRSSSSSSSSVGAGNPDYAAIASSSGVESYNDQSPDVVGIAGIDYDVDV